MPGYGLRNKVKGQSAKVKGQRFVIPEVAESAELVIEFHQIY
jgi:hypothetical protein